MSEPKTKLDEMLTRLKNHRVIAWIVVGTIVLGGAASILKDVKEVSTTFRTPSGNANAKNLVELISILEIQDSSDADYFIKTVRPIFEDFKIIHQKYVRSFRTFHAALSSGELEFSDLVLVMRNEYLFSEHDRSQLRALLQVYQQSLDSLQIDAETRRVLSKFYVEIYNYLTVVHSDGGRYIQRFYLNTAGLLIHLEKYGTMSRNEAIEPSNKQAIGHIDNIENPSSTMHASLLSKYHESGSSKQEIGIKVLEDAVQSMQSSFSKVSSYYAELTILLEPTMKTRRDSRSSNNEFSRTYFLRNTPRSNLSELEAEQMLIERGFYDQNLNEKGSGVQHKYETVLVGDARIVYDYITGLTWQQDGSRDMQYIELAGKYIEELNKGNFAGYSDWRLPTLEEAMSLVESDTRQGINLQIDPIFDGHQSIIWTADLSPHSTVWKVKFHDGSCANYSWGSGQARVRAVR